MTVAEVSEREAAELVRLRRDFHRHPELAFGETRTAGIVARRLFELGYDVREGVAGTGVLADAGRTGPTLLVRADMDALPVEEENDVEYKSSAPGVMHACGHDGHTAIALVLAERLAARRGAGRVRFAFQPAEELGSGADRMIEEGELDGVDAALGLHLWNFLPFGTVGVTAGPAMAAVDDFEIEIAGRGGHAGKPHEADDPIVDAARLVQDVQTIASRRIDPFETVVVSVTSIHGGTAFNVIPDRVHLKGTIRTFSGEVRRQAHERLREMVDSCGTIVIHSRTRALANDPAVCEIVREAAAEVVGAANVRSDTRTMAGEDFASVLARVPGCFFFVGSARPEGAAPHHNPHFDIDERALPVGLEILSRAAARYWESGIGG